MDEGSTQSRAFDGDSAQVEQDFSGFHIFMISGSSTIKFPFGDRRELVSIDSNCSHHMTGFYDLLDTTPCDVEVHGAFDQGPQGKATVRGLLQLGQLYFEDTVFVPGLRETILSLGQLDQQGCVTKISGGKLLVYSPPGGFYSQLFYTTGGTF